MENTLGEKRVRISLNSSAQDKVTQIKSKAAELINLVNSLEISMGRENPEFGEFMRLKALAMTDIESAATWGAKAATI